MNSIPDLFCPAPDHFRVQAPPQGLAPVKFPEVIPEGRAAAAAAAKSPQSNSVRHHGRQPTRLLCPWDCPGKNTGVGCHFLLQSMKVKSESEVAQSCPTPCDPTGAHQAPPSMGFSRQEYWSGLPLPSPRGKSLCLKSQ